ncbi:hypothetical protein TPY_3422 [Sulfobacillus acidophilus TPY]|nr:hypothetical protein TPY_3422 [Sulfobacillus acidophilus TPY]
MAVTVSPVFGMRQLDHGTVGDGELTQNRVFPFQGDTQAYRL